MPRGQYNRDKKEVIEEEAVEETSINALETTNDDEPIAEYTPELTLGLVDNSNLNDLDKHESIIRIIKILPVEYMKTEEDKKRNVWNLARFEPTNKQLDAAYEAIGNEPKRD
jgi:hypothetical protein